LSFRFSLTNLQLRESKQALQTTQRTTNQKDLKKMLFNLTTATGTLPSGLNIKGNGIEVRIISQYVVQKGDNYDIYKGEYLDAVPVSN
jgi:hypothetical protein